MLLSFSPDFSSYIGALPYTWIDVQYSFLTCISDLTIGLDFVFGET